LNLILKRVHENVMKAFGFEKQCSRSKQNMNAALSLIPLSTIFTYLAAKKDAWGVR
jgi:hypothetical protein